MAEKWGPGEAAKTAKGFEKGIMRGGQEYELFHGDGPHSTNDNSFYARFPDGRVEEFSGHRIQIRVEVETYNYLKQSGLSGDEIRKGGEARIILNGTCWMSFFFRDAERALLKAHEMIPKLCEHSLDLWRPDAAEKMRGRKIWYRDIFPAIVEYAIPEQGEVIIRHDADGPFPSAGWAKEEGMENPSPTHRVSLLSENIFWHRK